MGSTFTTTAPLSLPHRCVASILEEFPQRAAPRRKAQRPRPARRLSRRRGRFGGGAALFAKEAGVHRAADLEHRVGTWTKCPGSAAQSTRNTSMKSLDYKRWTVAARLRACAPGTGIARSNVGKQANDSGPSIMLIRRQPTQRSPRRRLPPLRRHREAAEHSRERWPAKRHPCQSRKVR